MRIYKVQKPYISSMWIAWLIHGFLPVKTWLLIAFYTAFYAIIMFQRAQTHVLTMKFTCCWCTDLVPWNHLLWATYFTKADPFVALICDLPWNTNINQKVQPPAGCETVTKYMYSAILFIPIGDISLNLWTWPCSEKVEFDLIPRVGWGQ